MAEILIKRCLAAIPLLLILSIVTFCAIKSLPGDPVDVLIGTAQRDIAPEQLSEFRKELGLDRSPVEQYLMWLKNGVMKGDLGRSYKDGRPVVTIIQETMPATAMLVGTALIIAFSVGIVWGLMMVWLRQTPWGWLTEPALFWIALVSYSAPSFWVGFIAISLAATAANGSFPILCVHPPGEPTTFLSALPYVILPASVLALRRTAKTALFVRAATLDELGKEYVVAALSKGLDRLTVLVKHVLRNSLSPIISLVGLSLPTMLGGAVLIETVFAWPGMGRLIVEATYGRNYPLILGMVLIYGTIVIVSNLLADVLQFVADPRTLEAEKEREGRGLLWSAFSKKGSATA